MLNTSAKINSAKFFNLPVFLTTGMVAFAPVKASADVIGLRITHDDNGFVVTQGAQYAQKDGFIDFMRFDPSGITRIVKLANIGDRIQSVEFNSPSLEEIRRTGKVQGKITYTACSELTPAGRQFIGEQIGKDIAAAKSAVDAAYSVRTNLTDKAGKPLLGTFSYHFQQSHAASCNTGAQQIAAVGASAKKPVQAARTAAVKKKPSVTPRKTDIAPSNSRLADNASAPQATPVDNKGAAVASSAPQPAPLESSPLAEIKQTEAVPAASPASTELDETLRNSIQESITRAMSVLDLAGQLAEQVKITVAALPPEQSVATVPTSTADNMPVASPTPDAMPTVAEQPTSTLLTEAKPTASAVDQSLSIVAPAIPTETATLNETAQASTNGSPAAVAPISTSVEPAMNATPSVVLPPAEAKDPATAAPLTAAPPVALDAGAPVTGPAPAIVITPADVPFSVSQRQQQNLSAQPPIRFPNTAFNRPRVVHAQAEIKAPAGKPMDGWLRDAILIFATAGVMGGLNRRVAIQKAFFAVGARLVTGAKNKWDTTTAFIHHKKEAVVAETNLAIDTIKTTRRNTVDRMHVLGRNAVNSVSNAYTSTVNKARALPGQTGNAVKNVGERFLTPSMATSLHTLDLKPAADQAARQQMAQRLRMEIQQAQSRLAELEHPTPMPVATSDLPTQSGIDPGAPGKSAVFGTGEVEGSIRNQDSSSLAKAIMVGGISAMAGISLRKLWSRSRVMGMAIVAMTPTSLLSSRQPEMGLPPVQQLVSVTSVRNEKMIDPPKNNVPAFDIVAEMTALANEVGANLLASKAASLSPLRGMIDLVSAEDVGVRRAVTQGFMAKARMPGARDAYITELKDLPPMEREWTIDLVNNTYSYMKEKPALRSQVIEQLYALCEYVDTTILPVQTSVAVSAQRKMTAHERRLQTLSSGVSSGAIKIAANEARRTVSRPTAASPQAYMDDQRRLRL